MKGESFLTSNISSFTQALESIVVTEDLCRGGERQSDQAPPRTAAVQEAAARQLGVDELPLTRLEGLEPAAGGVLVVGAGVDDPVLDVVGRRVRAARRVGIHPELEHQHPRQAELVAQPLHRRRDHAQVLGDQGQPRAQRSFQRR